MDNRISDKDLEFVNGGVNNSEEAISRAIGLLQEAVTLCAQSPLLSDFYEPQISGLIQRLQSCNGDYGVINEVVIELSCIKTDLNLDINNLSYDEAQRIICKNVKSFLLKAIDLLS